jgi:tripartite-type tricarboxylate transporter receptor subunit TctC
MRLSPFVLAAPLVGLIVVTPAISRAESSDYFQGKTITIYVDNPVGGGYDLNARTLARHLGDHIPGHPEIIVSNMPGAHGIRGANYIYNVAPKDGTAIGAEIADLAEYQVEGIGGVSYDASRFGWIGSIAPTNIVLYVWHTVPVQTIADLKSRETVLASFGPVPTYAKLLEELVGARFKIVDGYDGINAANMALERGEVEASLSSLPVLRAYHPDWLTKKMIRIFYYEGFKRSPDLPDVPASIELAKTDSDRSVMSFFIKNDAIGRAFVVPPGVQPAVLQTLRGAFDATMKDDQFLADCRNSRIDVNPRSGQEVEKTVGDMINVDAATRARVSEIAGGRL